MAHIDYKLQISRDHYSALGKYYFILTSLCSFLGISYQVVLKTRLKGLCSRMHFIKFIKQNQFKMLT